MASNSRDKHISNCQCTLSSFIDVITRSITSWLKCIGKPVDVSTYEKQLHRSSVKKKERKRKNKEKSEGKTITTDKALRSRIFPVFLELFRTLENEIICTDETLISSYYYHVAIILSRNNLSQFLNGRIILYGEIYHFKKIHQVILFICRFLYQNPNRTM